MTRVMHGQSTSGEQRRWRRDPEDDLFAPAVVYSLLPGFTTNVHTVPIAQQAALHATS